MSTPELPDDVPLGDLLRPLSAKVLPKSAQRDSYGNPISDARALVIQSGVCKPPAGSSPWIKQPNFRKDK